MVDHGARVAGVAVDHENREKDDFYPTPPRGTQALLEVEKFDGPIWEPACGDGAISKVLIEAGYDVVSTDLVDRGYGTPRVGFLMEWLPKAPNIITNPPFKLIKKNAPFIRKALDLASGKVAMLLRLACLEGGERGRLYAEHPPRKIWVFSSRLSMYRNGEEMDNGGMTAFAWFVWDKGYRGDTTVGWLP